MSAIIRRIWDYLRRERLLWFVVFGAALFYLDALRQDADTRRITIDLPLIEKLATQWQAQVKRPVQPRELTGLVEGHIREEILMREAIALGLNEDDIIIRRRLAQKMEFLLNDRTQTPMPPQTAIENYYEIHQKTFETPPKFSFRHIFLSDDLAADEIRTALKTGRDWRDLGRPFILQREYSSRSATELRQLFGDEFVTALQAQNLAPQDENKIWVGPIKSAYGTHLVHITRFIPHGIPALRKIRPRVIAAWQEEMQNASNRAAWEKLRARYQVSYAPDIFAPPAPPASPASPTQKEPQ